MRVLVGKDPLYPLTPEDKALIWRHRFLLMVPPPAAAQPPRHLPSHTHERTQNDPAALPKFLLSVDWGRRTQVLQAHRLLYQWHPPDPLVALMLLDNKYADPKVRALLPARAVAMRALTPPPPLLPLLPPPPPRFARTQCNSWRRWATSSCRSTCCSWCSAPSMTPSTTPPSRASCCAARWPASAWWGTSSSGS